jgi:tetratricopeptide (TPR) repeat protein
MEFKSEILQLIPFADSIDYEWTWTYHEEKEDAKNFFLSSLQGYQMTLYNTNDDSLLYPMREIALEILKYNPNHVESLSTYALTYIILGEYEPGIEALLKAEELAPTDIIVLNNLAQAYKRNGDTALAIVYYEKILEIGDERDKKMAQSEIDKLKSE